MGSGGQHVDSKRRLWECSGFDESLATCEDVDLCYRVAQNYRVVEDTKIRCFHHGEPKTLRQVFRKELWRGRDNFLGVFRHGFRWDELPSLVLPMYTVATLGLFLTSPLFGVFNDWGAWPVLGAAALFVLPPVAIAALTGARAGNMRYVPQLALVYGVYFLARGLRHFTGGAMSDPSIQTQKKVLMIAYFFSADRRYRSGGLAKNAEICQISPPLCLASCHTDGP